VHLLDSAGAFPDRNAARAIVVAVPPDQRPISLQEEPYAKQL
jgi:hypothetical protein